MAKKEKHYHLLKRHRYGNGEEVYFCTLNCTFKVSVKLALGKIVLCNSCQIPFEMNAKSIRLARPKCNSCSDTSPKALRSKKEKGIISVDDLGIELPNVQAPRVEDVKGDLKSRMHLLRNPQLPASTRSIDNTQNEVDAEILEKLEKDELL